MAFPVQESHPESTLAPAVPGEAREIPITREELVVQTDPHSRIAEQFRRLRNSIRALNPDGAARSVLLTSASDSEGKTVATLNLALALAELPQLKVLVIDGDVRGPGIELYLDLPPRQGFVELLRGQLPLDQAIRQTSVPNLDIVSAGAKPDFPARILDVDRIRAVLNSFKRRYDFVLVDAPSVLSMNHPAVLGSIADGILLVVGLGKSSNRRSTKHFSCSRPSAATCSARVSLEFLS